MPLPGAQSQLWVSPSTCRPWSVPAGGGQGCLHVSSSCSQPGKLLHLPHCGVISADSNRSRRGNVHPSCRPAYSSRPAAACLPRGGLGTNEACGEDSAQLHSTSAECAWTTCSKSRVPLTRMSSPSLHNGGLRTALSSATRLLCTEEVGVYLNVSLYSLTCSSVKPVACKHIMQWATIFKLSRLTPQAATCL